MLFFVVFGTIAWLNGFFRAGFRYPEGPPFVRSFIRPPFLIYLLCGLPRASNLPKGVISTGAVMIQFLGILSASYGIVVNRLSNQNLLIHMLSLVILAIGILLLCWLLDKKYEFLSTDTKDKN